MSDLPNLELVIKLLKMTTSANDNEALVALRKANDAVSQFTDWETLLRGKVTIIADPFESLDLPKDKTSDGYRPHVPTPPSPQRPARPTPPPPPQQPKPRPVAPTPPPPPPAPQATFAKTRTGHWRVKTVAYLNPGDFVEVKTRSNTPSRVCITSFDSVNSFGERLYHFTNAPQSAADLL